MELGSCPSTLVVGNREIQIKSAEDQGGINCCLQNIEAVKDGSIDLEVGQDALRCTGGPSPQASHPYFSELFTLPSFTEGEMVGWTGPSACLYPFLQLEPQLGHLDTPGQITLDAEMFNETQPVSFQCVSIQLGK